MIEILFQQMDEPWEGEETARRLVALMADNPFSPFDKMAFDLAEEWDEADPAKAVEPLAGKPSFGVEFTTEEPHPLDGSISRQPSQCTIRLVPDEAYLGNGSDLLLDLARQWVAALPAPSWGRILADEAVPAVYDQAGLPWLPDCFAAFTGWLHVLPRRGYEKWFTRRDLLEAPAHKVTEHDDGTIYLQVYEDPLAYGDAAYRERIVELTTYLNERRQDWAANTGG